MTKKAIIQFEYECTKLIRAHNTESLRRIFKQRGSAPFLTYELMYEVCKNGNFDTFKLFVDNGVYPNTRDAEWVAVGKNDHQRDIFSYIINEFSLPISHRRYLIAKIAFKKQRLNTLKRLLMLCINDAKTNDRIDVIADIYTDLLYLAANFNQPSVVELLIKRMNEDEALNSEIQKLCLNKGYYSIEEIVNKRIIPSVIARRRHGNLVTLSTYYTLGNLQDTDSLVKKSYSDSKISKTFYALPITERHGLLNGMNNTGKQKLAISLFESIPKSTIPTDPWHLARLLYPVIKAYNTDPILFFERNDIPDAWHPALPILLAD